MNTFSYLYTWFNEGSFRHLAIVHWEATVWQSIKQIVAKQWALYSWVPNANATLIELVCWKLPLIKLPHLWAPPNEVQAHLPTGGPNSLCTYQLKPRPPPPPRAYVGLCGGFLWYLKSWLAPGGGGFLRICLAYSYGSRGMRWGFDSCLVCSR